MTASGQPCEVGHVLFVCVHNAGRSQMAQAFFTRLARQRRLTWVADSAGTAPAECLNPTVAAVMAEAGLSLEGHRPRPLTLEMAAHADLIITMGCGVEPEQCPAGTYIAEDWQLPDPHGQAVEVVREIRDGVCARVEALVERLAAEEARIQR